MERLLDLYHGNCLGVLPTLPDKSIDLVLSDLPYQVTRNAWDVALPLDELWTQYKRLLRPHGSVVLTASQPFTSRLVMSNLKWFRHEWIWIKSYGSNFLNCKREPLKEHESVLVFSPGKWTYNQQMQERYGSGKALIGKAISSGGGSDCYNGGYSSRMRVRPELRVPSSHQRFTNERGLHPTQKPVTLFEYLIKTYSNEGATVLDNCMGSGTTGVACKRLNRNFVGIELDESYFDIAEKRIKNADT